MKSSLRLAVHCTLLIASAVANAADRHSSDAPLNQIAMLTPNRALTSIGVPNDRELESRGARIGKIHVAIDDVFERSWSLTAPYRLVNTLHITTQTDTVIQQLLFRQGDRFDPHVLNESERLLRDQRYLSDASIETLHYNETDNTVDVMVRVHDVWTMSPGISFGRKGGENSARFEFEDTNFLGLGKTVSLERAANVDRTAWRLGYVDPHVVGSWWRLAAAHSILSDGYDDQFSFGRPFYSLDSRWSAAVNVIDSALTTPVYSLGKQVGRFNTETKKLGFDAGVSRGLIDGWTTRYLFGARYDARNFVPDAINPTAFTPTDRRYAYPYVGVQWIEDAFITTRNLNQIGRTEDMHLGRSLAMTAGFAASALGSSDNAIMLTTTGEAGLNLGNEQYLIGNLDLSSRISSNGPRNTQFDIGGHYLRRQSEDRVFFAGLNAGYRGHPDEDVQLLLGGDNGLRGYPLRYQAGTSLTVLTLEERFYTHWQPLKLVNVGAAVFADTGRMWGHDRFAATPDGWLSDVGFGLRLGSARSGLGNILHVDVAFPLNRTDDLDAVQFLVETKKSF